MIEGLTAGAGPAEIAYAAFEAVAHQVADVVEAIESDRAVRLEALHADGGATASVLLMQILADLLGRTVRVAQTAEASALGAALMAARVLGFAPVLAPGGPREVVPTKSPEWRRTHREAWRNAVARSCARIADQ